MRFSPIGARPGQSRPAPAPIGENKACVIRGHRRAQRRPERI